MLKKLKEISWSRLKDIAESVQKLPVNHAYYKLESKDKEDILSHCLLNKFDCPINLI